MFNFLKSCLQGKGDEVVTSGFDNIESATQVVAKVEAKKLAMITAVVDLDSNDIDIETEFNTQQLTPDHLNKVQSVLSAIRATQDTKAKVTQPRNTNS